MNDIMELLMAERVDIVEADGRLRISLYNSASHPFPLPEGASGMAFFDCDEQEYGGLVLQSSGAFSGVYESNLSMTFGKRDKQAVEYFIREENGKRKYGYSVYDTINAEGVQEASCERLFVGKDTDGSMVVRLKDSKGNERISLLLDSDGEVRIAVLDEQGKVIATL